VTYYGSVRLGGDIAQCVYKPVSGERPLWDFPDGTLAYREVAAYAVSVTTGWDVVPLTVLRDGPAGIGMVQLWCETDQQADAVDLARPGRVPNGYLSVLDAYDAHDRPVVLVHEDSEALRRMAIFDVLVNNADRKGGHVLALPDGGRRGVDHGVCFHEEHKLRTVLWGWADRRIPAEDLEVVAKVAEDPALCQTLSGLLAPSEVRAFQGRCRRLLRTGRMPVPGGGWPPVPWPAF
jgi:uncharacterized repeat protein (TIGR03843 family)